jgi:hypothetical protein
MLNQISLVWRRYADSPILSVDARGLTRQELRHYAQQVGFIAFSGGDGQPALVGNQGRCAALVRILETEGYEVEEVAA